MSRWNVYLLRCADGTLYTGITTDLAARLATHNAKKGAKYTRSRLPVTLVWSLQCRTESIARKREILIKKLRRIEKEFLLELTHANHLH
ncbi:MAG: GIY-YIG nuclease family protein [Patescibacteria group bacterium]